MYIYISAHLPTYTHTHPTHTHTYRRRILLQDEPYKLEVLDSIKTEPITIYHVGDRWWDLCAGPHLESTGKRVIG